MSLTHRDVDAAEFIVRTIAMCEEQSKYHAEDGDAAKKKIEAMKGAAYRTALYYVLLERRCRESGNSTASSQGIYEEIDKLVKAKKEEFFGVY